jgi:hypothetical protein
MVSLRARIGQVCLTHQINARLHMRYRSARRTPAIDAPEGLSFAADGRIQKAPVVDPAI